MKTSLLFNWCLWIALFFITQSVNAQEVSVSGTVISGTDNLPVIGASVVQKGTTNGNITDMDGNSGKDLTAQKASEILQPYNDKAALRIRTTLKLSHATSAGLNLFGQRLMDYDMNFNRVNGVFYSPEDMTSMEITADIIIDQTCIEVFIDGGAYSYYMERKADTNNKEGYHFWGNNIEVKNLEVYTLRSIWK